MRLRNRAVPSGLAFVGAIGAVLALSSPASAADPDWPVCGDSPGPDSAVNNRACLITHSESNNASRVAVSLNSTGLLADFAPVPVPKQICGTFYRVWGTWEDPGDGRSGWVPYERYQHANSCSNGTAGVEYHPDTAFRPGSQLCAAVGYSSTGTPGSEKWSGPLCRRVH